MEVQLQKRSSAIRQAVRPNATLTKTPIHSCFPGDVKAPNATVEKRVVGKGLALVMAVSAMIGNAMAQGVNVPETIIAPQAV